METVVMKVEQYMKLLGPGKVFHNPGNSIPAKYRSTWYLTPLQHARECLFVGILCTTLLLLSLYKVRKSIANTIVRAPTKLDAFCGILAFGPVFVSFYYKYTSPYSWRLPFLLQPCHVLSTVLAITCILPGRVSNVLFQIYVSLSWSAVLAFVFPDQSDYEFYIDMANYWVEHTVMLLVPLNLMKTKRFPMCANLWWYVLGYTVTALYHFIIVQYAALHTELNIATMMSPPPVMVSYGIHYRIVLTSALFVGHVLYNYSIQFLLGKMLPNKLKRN